MEFTIEELKDDTLEELMHFAKEQADRLYATSRSRNDSRTLEEILDNCIIGSIPEFYLLQQGFSRNTGRYQDLVDSNGNKIEIKSIRGSENSLAKANDKVTNLLIMENDMRNNNRINTDERLFDYLYLFSIDAGIFKLEHVLDRRRNRVDPHTLEIIDE